MVCNTDIYITWLWTIQSNLNNLDRWIGLNLSVSTNFGHTLTMIIDFESLNQVVLKGIPNKLQNFESILIENLFVNKFRLSKFIKHNFKLMLLNPILFFNKNKRTIKFHFDMMHGHGNLDKAIK